MNEDTERRRFIDVLRGFDDAQLVTRATSGLLHARPMALAQVEDDGTAWFVTSSETAKVDEIRHESEVAVVAQAKMKYASLAGIARVVRDQDKVRALWRETWRPWFPNGPDTPDIVLLRVEPLIGEYWDQAGAKGVRFLWEAAKAVLKGERLQDRPQEGQKHAKVEL